MTVLAVADGVWVGAIVGLVIVIIALIPKRSLTATLGKMAVTLGSIDNNTNHQPEGEDGSPPPTMSEQVREIGKDVKTLRSAVVDLHGQNVDRLDELAKVVAAGAEVTQTHSEQIATLTTNLAILGETVARMQAS